MTAPAPPWTIAATVERVELDSAGQAETTFTVTNSGPVDQRVVLDVVSGDGTDRVGFTVAEPQRLVPHGGSATFLVRIAVPAGAQPGDRWLAGRAYSADTAPEESSVLSGRVAFEVPPSEPPPPPWWRRYWWLLAAAALAAVVLGVVLALVLGSDGPPPGGTSTPSPSPSPSPTLTVLREEPAGSLAANQVIDLDEIVRTGPATANDLLYQPLLPGDGFITPLNGATIVKIGATGTPATGCARATPASSQVQVSQWAIGEVLCVRTNAGRLSTIVLNQKLSALILPPPPPQLRISITTFDNPGAGQ